MVKRVINRIIFKHREERETRQIIKRRLEQIKGATDPMLIFLDHNKSREELCYLAFVDRLTKTYNRNMLEELREKFDSMDIFVTIIDIDNLKIVNDAKGHDAGDRYIRDIADKIKCCSDWVFRLGGDEFLAIAKMPVIFEMLGASYGTVYKPSNLSLNTAMKTADFLMYKNKKSKGRR